MMVKEKRDLRPVLFQFGVALALSLGGILCSILRTKRIKPSQSSSPPSTPDCCNQVDSEGATAGIGSDYQGFETSSSSNSASISPEKHEECHLRKVSSDSSVAKLSPSGKYCGFKDGFLSLEFNRPETEFDLAAPNAGFSPLKDVETPHLDRVTPRGFKHTERDDYEAEIKNLKDMVRILRERGRTLEIQLLEYYGLKEQETAVMELQNRLKIHNTEAKLFSLKIESLQADNKRLEAQVADYAKVVVELEAARTQIKLLKKKLKSETERNKEQILTLQERVKKLLDQEHGAVSSDLDIEFNLQQVKVLEEEIEELRKSNHNLQLENSDLAQKLERTQMLATSVLEDQEAEALKEESRCLRHQNEDLSKEIEQLKADRCADLEELVYLRWINACLRYELRNYEPGPEKTIARDLSRTLSPKSEEKAKQLIIEYASKEGFAEKRMDFTDTDFDWLSSFHSYLTDSGEFDDSSIDYSSATKTETSSQARIFSKLRRLIQGKDSDHRSWSLSPERTASNGCNLGVSSGINAGTDGCRNRLRSASLGSSRISLDFEIFGNTKVDAVKGLQGVRRNSDSDISFPCVYKSLVSGRKGVSDSLPKDQLLANPGMVQKSELVKYAEVLKESSSEGSKFHRRSATYC